jgi:hypothetical protein
MSMKTTKTVEFFNQNKNKDKPSSKSKSWNKKNKNKNTTNANKNPTKFYYKEEIKQSYDKKKKSKTYLE